MTRYEVTKRAPDGTYLGAVAGMGRHRGTWDSDHSRSAAYRHARILRQADPDQPLHRGADSMKTYIVQGRQQHGGRLIFLGEQNARSEIGAIANIAAYLRAGGENFVELVATEKTP